MTIREGPEAAPSIRALLELGAASNLTDGQLLGRFAARDRGSAGSAPFAILVERHGPMVLRTCRDVLGDPDDARDAFQATFLVLVRKADSIRGRDSLASWLHGVALRVAAHARADAARRRRHERRAGEIARLSVAVEGPDDLGPRIREEVGRLPDRYREPVVLCYLEGQTCEDAARILRWPVGTVKSRLARARERLRRRLSRFGPASVPAFGDGAPVATLSPRLADATAGVAARFGAVWPASASISAPVALAQGVLKMILIAKMARIAFALSAASLLGAAVALTSGAPGRAGQDAAREARRADEAPGPMSPFVPRNLAVRAGRGTALFFALDGKGERIPDRPGGPWKEADLPLRWVAIVGILDHGAIREVEARARTVELAASHSRYRRAEVERQLREPGGAWSDWKPIDSRKNYQILDNLPEVARERTPERFRSTALVDPLPFLKEGTWAGVDDEGVLKLAQVEDPSRKPAAQSVPPVVMIRSLDFTVDPGKTYRYRIRIVVDDPSPDRVAERGMIYWPWSEPTPEATTPEGHP